MKKEPIIIGLVIVAAVVVLYYYLHGKGGPVQITYPNGQASGVPADQNAAATYNIQTPRRSPDPSLIYGNLPPLPPTPSYQVYNYAPVNLLGLTTQGAMAVTKPATPGKPGTPSVGPGQTDKGNCCGCGSGCDGCGCHAGSGTYQDGGAGSCLVANPSEQARATPSVQLGNLARNIASSTVGTDSEGQGLPTGVVIATTGQAPARPTINNAPPPTSEPNPAPPAPSGGFLPWAVAGKLLGLNGNAMAESWYEKSAGFNGNG